MTKETRRAPRALTQPQSFVAKSPTGTPGLDDITRGGIPKGRNTLACGGARTPKTLFAMKYLLCGALQYGEPGLCVSLEKSAEEIAQNMASLAYDVPTLTKNKMFAIA